MISEIVHKRKHGTNYIKHEFRAKKNATINLPFNCFEHCDAGEKPTNQIDGNPCSIKVSSMACHGVVQIKIKHEEMIVRSINISSMPSVQSI